MVSNQEVFNRVWNWFVVNQNPLCQRDVKGNAACSYRGPEGSRCAIGLLIPDEVYQPAFEGMDIAQLYGKLRDYLPDDVEFCSQLQKAHDGASNHSEMSFVNSIHQRLIRLANRFGLEVPE